MWKRNVLKLTYKFRMYLTHLGIISVSFLFDQAVGDSRTDGGPAKGWWWKEHGCKLLKRDRVCNGATAGQKTGANYHQCYDFCLAKSCTKMWWGAPRFFKNGRGVNCKVYRNWECKSDKKGTGHIWKAHTPCVRQCPKNAQNKGNKCCEWLLFIFDQFFNVTLRLGLGQLGCVQCVQGQLWPEGNTITK